MDQGSSSSSTTWPSNITMQARQLNDSLYELYKPSIRPSMHVLFFHGFQLGDNYNDAHLSTWKSGDGSCIWPQSWLVEKFPDAHILSISYNARVTKCREYGNVDLFIIGENLASDLLEAKIGLQPRCPVILVGHSFGGMVIKQLCVHASNAKNDPKGGSNLGNFLENVRGMFFYATPHHGIPLATHFMQESPLLEFVKTLSMHTERLNFHFDSLCNQYKAWQIAGLGESLPLKWGKFHDLVLPEASARLGSSFNIVEGADHISISRPPTKLSRGFNALINFLNNTAGNVKSEEIPENFQHLPKPTVEIDHALETVKRKLGMVTTLGFAGMGGIGKTTLAMALFNDLEHQYEYTCFLKNVKNNKLSIRQAVLEDLHHWGKKIARRDGELGFLRGKLLLLILDDVASEDDLVIIPTLLDDFAVHEKSRFVATCRDFELLDLCLDEVHRVSFLSRESSRHLFLTYAFPKGVPLTFVGYTNDIVQKCAGLPLTLEVVGKYLYKKREPVWKQAIEALDRAEAVTPFDEKLWAKLKISYDGLDKVEQDMFLDAATVFYGFDLDSAMAAWSVTTGGFQHIRWKKLVALSLVWEVPEDDGDLEKGTGIGMHEQLLSLAKKLASTTGEKGYWIWDDNQKAWDLLSAKTITVHDVKVDVKDVVALRVHGHALLGMASTSEAQASLLGSTLWKMEKLRYLSMEFMGMDQSYYITLPPTLVCLRLFGENFSILPFDPCFYGEMAILSLQCDYLDSLPATFGHLTSLQMLYIKSYWLKSLPDSFGCLASLKYLKIKECHSLQTFPDSFGNLVALEYLNISQCQSLQALPNSIGRLTRLKKLDIHGCELLCELPETLLQLQKLEHIELHYTSLLDIPNLWNLMSLKTLVAQRYIAAKFPRWLEKVIEDQNTPYFTLSVVNHGQYVLLKKK